MAGPPSVWVRIVRVKGSAPRAAGTAMEVFVEGQCGTIGGGALEWDATRIAREILAGRAAAHERHIPLGPDLGQCCGGSVTLAFELHAPKAPHSAPPLWIWGAGHVGRALAGVMAPLGDRSITLIDDAAERMPQELPAGVAPLVAADMPRAVAHAPGAALHLILTYSHKIDLRLCDALLRHPNGGVGLIGSATKWARFRSRLRAMGHADAQISRIACPIGDPSLGKHPQAIAVGVAAGLLSAATTGDNDQ